MARHTDLQIHKTGYELLSLAADVQKHMPRQFRTLGMRIADECTEMLVLIGRANASQGSSRAQAIEALLQRLEVATLLLRVGHDKHLVDHKLWAHAIQLTDSIGKQAGGWLKSARVNSYGKAPAA